MALKPAAYTRPLEYARTRTLQRVGGRGGHDEAGGVSLGGMASSADLGSSSKYSSEILEDRSG